MNTYLNWKKRQLELKIREPFDYLVKDTCPVCQIGKIIIHVIDEISYYGARKGVIGSKNTDCCIQQRVSPVHCSNCHVLFYIKLTEEQEKEIRNN